MGIISDVRTKYLIIGNSGGGIGAAEAIREVDRVGSLTIISDEPYPAYSRPLISKYLTGERTLDDILFRPADFYGRNDIAFLADRHVKSLDPEAHACELEGGERMAWERLLLATGGTPIVPSMDWMGQTGVFTFTTLDDAKAIRAFLGKGDKAVVIGGGLIGVSVTEALVKRGVEVAIVEMRERILNTILDEQASSLAEDALRRADVDIITSHTVAQICGEQEVSGVVLEDGKEISCDLVVVAIGVTPRTELALGAGIKVNRGIVVDRHMATSHPNIYSCGDVAEAFDFVYGANRLTPIWPNAYIGGRTAGFNMAGMTAEYPAVTAMNSLNYFGLDIAAAGMVVPPPESSYEVLSRIADGSYRKVVLKDDLIMGMVFVGDIDKSGIVYGLMRDRVNVSSFKQELLDDDFGLASLPRQLWQERLGIPPVGLVPQTAIPARAAEEPAGE
ncbi:MAG: pyridine nucleotide-disulfide oxidoreductase [Chloroflexi bacterium RBG_13_54_9]|nr:MAG: pyridine nucleotide-disulfide oxidoreductase [Chloroflexi bacterium RBG_13_54_9]